MTHVHIQLARITTVSDEEATILQLQGEFVMEEDLYLEYLEDMKSILEEAGLPNPHRPAVPEMFRFVFDRDA